MNSIQVRIFIFIASVMFAQQTFANKVYMALVPTQKSQHAIVTIIEQKCNQLEGNALYLHEKSIAKGLS